MIGQPTRWATIQRLVAIGAPDAFLAAHPTLAADIRRKILVARDELEVVVRVRAAAAA